MTEIICTKCGEVKLDSSRVIVTPFVCRGCAGRSIDPALLEETQMKTSNIADPAGLLDETVTFPGQGQYPVEVELNDETATTMSTVELIADLESQLSLAKELTQGQTELIEQLEQQIEILNAEKQKALDDFVGAELKNADEGTIVERLTQYLDALAFYYGYEVAKNEQLKADNEAFKDIIAKLSTVAGIEVIFA